ncbi:hypothetical protein [Haladaptatus sp. NG-SE-30]
MSEGSMKARAILRPFDRPLWQNVLVPVVSIIVWLGGYAGTLFFTNNWDLAAAFSTDAIAARRQARIVAMFAMGVFIGFAIGFAYGWPVLNVMFPIFLPHLLPASAYVVFQGPVPEDIWTTGEFYLGVGGGYSQWFADISWVGIAAAVGLFGTLVLFDKLYLTTVERKKAWIDRFPF